jgi:hypothetical protein
MKLGRFSDEAINAAKQLLSDSIEFSELETMDFGRCQRPDGSFYGTSGQCRKGKDAGAKEAAAPKPKKTSGAGGEDSSEKLAGVVDEGRGHKKYDEVVKAMTKSAKGPLEKIIDSNGSIEDAMRDSFRDNGAWADFDGIAGQLLDDMGSGDKKLGSKIQAVFNAVKDKSKAEDFVKQIVAKAGVQIAEERGWEDES